MFSFADSWEGLTAINRETKWDDKPDAVFVGWSPRGRLRGTAPAGDLKPAAPPFHYLDLEIVAYVRDAAPLASADY
jgi:hypothetical protein